jgi:hypothetical protein
MNHRRWLWVLIVLLAPVGEVKAQIFYQVYNPYPVPIGYAYGSSGIGFAVKKRSFVAGGFIGSGYIAAGPIGYSPFLPFGVADRSVTVQIIQPPNIVLSSRVPRRGVQDDDDLSGIDLDLVPTKKEAIVKKEAAPARIAPPAEDLPKLPRAPEKPEPPKKIEMPPPPPGPNVKEPGPLSPPKKDPADEYVRLLDIGQDAFNLQLYGIAAQRFHQAIALKPGGAKAHFLLSQAQFALGKYRDAVASIQRGMKLDADWPKDKFQPRRDLYKNHQDFADHLNRLEDIVAMQPGNGGFLFLLAHQMWFDGQRNRAVALFRQARALTPDPTFIDMFLRAAGPGPLAAK